jgi:uncharacterized protein (DUF1330 family)
VFVTKVAPVMQLRALVVRNDSSARFHILHHSSGAETAPLATGLTERSLRNRVERLQNLLATSGADTAARPTVKCMTVYAIAQLKFTDRAAYDRYQAAFIEIFQQYSGTLLAADESPRVVEGSWDREKVVLMSFPDEAAFSEWADSPDYQRISQDRRAGADTVVVLARGLS